MAKNASLDKKNAILKGNFLIIKDILKAVPNSSLNGYQYAKLPEGNQSKLKTEFLVKAIKILEDSSPNAITKIDESVDSAAVPADDATPSGVPAAAAAAAADDAAAGKGNVLGFLGFGGKKLKTKKNRKRKTVRKRSNKSSRRRR